MAAAHGDRSGGARPLPERLRKYYQDEGRKDSIETAWRPRSFVPEFADRATPGASGAPAGSTPKAAGIRGFRAWLSAHHTVAIALAGLVLPF